MMNPCSSAAGRLLRVLGLAAGIAATAPVAAQGTGVPLRNLLIELRQTDEASSSRQGAGVSGGAVVIGSNGQTGGMRIGAQSRSRDATREAVQQVRVLNGGQASIRLAQSAPLQFVQVVWTQQGAQVLPSTLWTETGRGFSVRPRWPGGDALATVEVNAESGNASADGSGASERGLLLTTVQLPLGEWVTIASTGETASDRRSGILSSSDAERSRGRLVQMRVSAP